MQFDATCHRGIDESHDRRTHRTAKATGVAVVALRQLPRQAPSLVWEWTASPVCVRFMPAPPSGCHRIIPKTCQKIIDCSAVCKPGCLPYTHQNEIIQPRSGYRHGYGTELCAVVPSCSTPISYPTANSLHCPDPPCGLRAACGGMRHIVSIFRAKLHHPTILASCDALHFRRECSVPIVTGNRGRQDSRLCRRIWSQGNATAWIVPYLCYQGG